MGHPRGALGVIIAKTSAFQAAALAAFDAAGGPEADGCKNLTTWLTHRGQMTKTAARHAARDTRTQGAHPRVAAVLSAGDITSSLAALICQLTAKLPAELRDSATRDRFCQWPGGCDAPPARCDVHHIIPRSQGGTTSLGNCTLMCKFHHLVAIHAWGWVLTMQAGVMRVTSPDGKTTYTSRAPPAKKAA